MKHLLLTILCCFLLSLSQAQNSHKEEKVGLVLSGGGAKGLAHIGVLKVIDSLNIKIDYIAGTSMGAVIGGLYASGHSAKTLDSIFTNIDFNKIISDKIPRKVKTVDQRKEDETYAFTLPFHKNKIGLPSGLSKGQNSFNLLSKLLLHVNNIKQFKDLPIPFFCVATDIETGEEVILDKGDLAKSIRASASLPTLYTPTNINNKRLIDGGVTNNYPIEEILNRDINLVIGVDVQDGLAEKNKLASASQIMLQINNFRTINSIKAKAKLTDIYIKPEISDFTILSFEEAEKIIEEGKLAALRNIDALKKLDKKKDHHKKIIPVQDSLLLKHINTNKTINNYRAFVLGKLNLSTNKKISYSDFTSGINNLIATNNFDDVYYKLQKLEGKDEFDLYIYTRETERKRFLKLAVHYDNLYKSALLVNVSQKQLLLPNDALSIDVILGQNVRARTNYFIDKGVYWSFGINAGYTGFSKNISPDFFYNNTFTNLNKIELKYRDLSSQVFIQTQLSKDLPFRIGIEHKYLNIKTETLVQNNNTNTTFSDDNIFSLFANLSWDTLDNRFFPKDGVLFKAKTNYYFHSSNKNQNFTDFFIIDASFCKAQSFTSKFSAKATISTGLQINRNTNFKSLDFAFGGYNQNMVNNMKSFYGYDFFSLNSNSYAMGAFEGNIEWTKKHHISFGGNLAIISNILYQDTNWYDSKKYQGYMLGYGLDSFLGPIEVKYTYSPDTQNSYWFFNFGYWF